ncbi:MAG: glutaredoxin family protein [Dehalococcoidia bacterium]|nr:glutaredoxin family protein [Dehalococcoidia bacterium]
MRPARRRGASRCGGARARSAAAVAERRPAGSTVTLYWRPGCHLCEQAGEALRALRPALAFELREVNVEGDAELERRFGERVPVVAVEGRELAVAPLDLAALRRALAAAVARS